VFLTKMKTKTKIVNSGCTLPEAVISLAIASLVFSSILLGYTMTTDHAEWSAYSLAAQSVAMQGVEQARAAQWDTRTAPPTDELGVTNFSQVITLDVPMTGGNPTLATNYISVTTISTLPMLRELRADCVWCLEFRGARTRGPFTNSVVTLRAPDQ
jgi:type II secretory pathway pseudopilin PulG